MNDRTVVLNASLVNYDGKVDYTGIASEVTVYESTKEEKILERIDGHQIVVTKEMKVSGEILEQFPESVKLIVEAGTGYNNLDLAMIRNRGIMLCNVPGYSSERVAHTAIMLLLNLASSMRKQIAMLEKGNHDNFHRYLMADHVEINGKVLGIIGYGDIAKEVIKVAQAMGMKILVSTRTPREDRDGVHFTTREEVFCQSDFISLHCPLLEDTRHLVDAAALEKMKKSAYIINTARGALIDEKALIKALEAGVIAGAGLDVQEEEPLADESPLYCMEQVIVTPHIGWRGLETRRRLVSMVGEDIAAYRSGNPINRIV